MNESPSGTSPPLTRERHIDQGKTARRRTPRELQADWSTGSRTSDPLTLLVGQETTRVDELVPIRPWWEQSSRGPLPLKERSE
jgi:hypothetical protein